MNIKKLNDEFSVDQQISIVEGNNGIPYIKVSNDAAHAIISLYGGQVLSYVSSNGKELLFLSELAHYDQGKAIKGGVPVCWPWFGVDPQAKGRQSHGFARNKMWQIRTTEKVNNRQSKVLLGLNDDSDSLEQWPYKFDLSLEISVGDTLELVLKTCNTDTLPFKITQALHTYFSVESIDNVLVKGLDKKKYLDKANINTGHEEKEQLGDVEFTQEVDRIYRDVPASLQLEDKAGKAKIDIVSSGNKTAVVWNPGADICQQMSDLEENDYRRFVCVETANAADDVVLVKPDESFELSVNYQMLSV